MQGAVEQVATGISREGSSRPIRPVQPWSEANDKQSGLEISEGRNRPTEITWMRTSGFIQEITQARAPTAVGIV
jgi:hypothetical protein